MNNSHNLDTIHNTNELDDAKYYADGTDRTLFKDISERSEANKNGSVRILALDGGGLKGVITCKILKALEEEAGEKICNLFDLMIGTSTGGLIALGLGHLRKTVADCDTLYDELGKKVFSTKQYGSLLSGTFRSYYSASRLEQVIKRFAGKEHGEEVPLVRTERKLVPGSPLVGVVSINANKSNRSVSCLLRDYDISGTGSILNIRDRLYPGFCRMKLWQAARATSAAPHYFDACKVKMKIDGIGTNKAHELTVQFVDGALNANVPVGVACVEASSIWPDRHIICVSIGTGKTLDSVFETSNWPAVDVQNIIECAMTSAQSNSIHTIKSLHASDKLDLVRWNDFISGEACGMDDYANIEYWRAVGQHWVDSNRDQIKDLAQMLKTVHVNDDNQIIKEFDQFKLELRAGLIHANEELERRELPVDIERNPNQDRREYVTDYDAVAWYFNKQNIDIANDLVETFQKKNCRAVVQFDKRARKDWLVIELANPTQEKWDAVETILQRKIAGWTTSCNFKFGVINNTAVKNILSGSRIVYS